MIGGTGVSAMYNEFTDALTEVLGENAVGPPTRKGARATAPGAGLERLFHLVDHAMPGRVRAHIER
jgi:hypothetical protein